MPGPMYLFDVKLSLSGQSDFVVAFAAIYRSAFAGFKWYFSFLATFGAYNGKHLAWSPVAAITVASCSPCLAACWAALGFIGVALGFKEFLFLGTEGKGIAAVGTLEGFVFEAHG